jgi:hypothetical protein
MKLENDSEEKLKGTVEAQMANGSWTTPAKRMGLILL